MSIRGESWNFSNYLVWSFPFHSRRNQAAEASSIDLPFECRSGICGQCKTRLLSGSVVMDSEDALTANEKANGWILACQAHATSDVVVEA